MSDGVVFDPRSAERIGETVRTVEGTPRERRYNRSRGPSPNQTAIYEGFLVSSLDPSTDDGETESTATLTTWKGKGDGWHEGDTITVTNRNDDFSAAAGQYLQVALVNGEWRPLQAPGALFKAEMIDDLEEGQAGSSSAWLLVWNVTTELWDRTEEIEVFADMGFKGVAFGKTDEVDEGDFLDIYFHAGQQTYHGIVGRQFVHARIVGPVELGNTGTATIELSGGREIDVEAHADVFPVPEDGGESPGGFVDVLLAWNSPALHWCVLCPSDVCKQIEDAAGLGLLGDNCQLHILPGCGTKFDETTGAFGVDFDNIGTCLLKKSEGTGPNDCDQLDLDLGEVAKPGGGLKVSEGSNACGGDQLEIDTDFFTGDCSPLNFDPMTGFGLNPDAFGGCMEASEPDENGCITMGPKLAPGMKCDDEGMGPDWACILGDGLEMGDGTSDGTSDCPDDTPIIKIKYTCREVVTDVTCDSTNGLQVTKEMMPIPDIDCGGMDLLSYGRLRKPQNGPRTRKQIGPDEPTDILYSIATAHKDWNTHREVVVARFNEDVTWTRSLNDPTTIYIKGANLRLPKNSDATVIRLPNVGREAQTFLHHICQNYSALADTTYFLQGDPFIHSPDILHRLHDGYDRPTPLAAQYSDIFPSQAAKDCDLIEQVNGHEVRYGDVRFFGDRNPEHNEEWLDVLWSKVFQNPKPADWRFAYSGMMAVPKQFIQARPKEDWERLLEASESDTLTAWCFEALWLYLFDPSYQLQEGEFLEGGPSPILRMASYGAGCPCCTTGCCRPYDSLTAEFSFGATIELLPTAPGGITWQGTTDDVGNCEGTLSVTLTCTDPMAPIWFIDVQHSLTPCLVGDPGDPVSISCNPLEIVWEGNVSQPAPPMFCTCIDLGPYTLTVTET